MTDSMQPHLIAHSYAVQDDAFPEGDCACADARVGQSAALSPRDGNGLVHTRPGLRIIPLQAEWSIAFHPLLPQAPVLVNQAARRLIASFGTPRALTRGEWDPEYRNTRSEAIVRRAIALGLLETTSPVAIPRANSTLLTAWIHTTDACNLHCSYCYLTKTNQAMTPETGLAAIQAVVRSAQQHGYTRLKLKYAGGEPLLRWSLVLQLHDAAAAQARQYGLALDEVVLSNGTLLTALHVEQMLERQMRLMISLDEIGANHSSQRAFRDHSGSAAAVLRAVEMARRGGVTPTISVTVSNRNLPGLPETLSYILERDLPFTLNWVRENDCALSPDDVRLDPQRTINGMLRAYKTIEAHLPRRSLLASLVDRAQFAAPHDYPCGAGHDYMVVDTHGRVAKCHMEMTRAVTDVFVDDPLGALRAARTGVQNPDAGAKTGCHDCDWRHWCAGGCPLATYRATGRYDIKSPYCDMYRALFPHVLRLEGLRLLRWN